MAYYVYYRVSTIGQDFERQKSEVEKYIKENDITVDAVFEDKKSGKNLERTQYQALKNTVKNGDTIIVKELDRLGRNYEELKDEWQDLTRRGVSIIVIDNQILSTEGKSDLEARLITDIVFNLLAYTAEKEREKTRQRVKEGINRAKDIGTRSGNPIGRPELSELPRDFYRCYPKWKSGDLTAVDFAKIVGVGRTTIYRYISKYENEVLKETS